MPKRFSTYALALALHVALAWALTRLIPFPPGSPCGKSPCWSACVIFYIGFVGFIFNFVAAYFMAEARERRRRRELEIIKDVMES